MTTREIEALPGYQAALQTSAFYHQSAIGWLRISGPDRVDFLQRQSTNDIKRLSDGNTLTTVLTDPAARILDVLTLFEDDEGFAAVTLPGNAEKTSAFLRSRIFFMDQVKLEDESDTYIHFHLIGPQTERTLEQLGVNAIPEDTALVDLAVDGAPAHLFRRWDWGWQISARLEVHEPIEAALEAAGAVRLSEASFTSLRVESGIPAGGHELTNDYTPLETGLRALISDTKGCYTGQEVIARQITYDKVTRHLVGLRLSALVEHGSRLWSPEGNQPAGEITSLVNSPRFGLIALGIIKRDFSRPGTSLRIGRDKSGGTAEVVTLPFQD